MFFRLLPLYCDMGTRIGDATLATKLNEDPVATYSLAEAGAITSSMCAEDIDVAVYDDGQRVYRTVLGVDGRSGADPAGAERAIAAATFFEDAGYGELVPAHGADFAAGYLGVTEAPGVALAEETKRDEILEPLQDRLPGRELPEDIFATYLRTGRPGTHGDSVVDAASHLHVQNAPETYMERVDTDAYLDAAGMSLLSGNSDMKPENVLAGPDGGLTVIDLDHAAGDLTEHVETYDRRHSHFERGLISAKAGADVIGLEISYDDILARTQSLAAEIEVETALARVENASRFGDEPWLRYRDNIAANIEAFAAGAFPADRGRYGERIESLAQI